MSTGIGDFLVACASGQEVSFPASAEGQPTGNVCTLHVKSVRLLDPTMDPEVAVEKYSKELNFQHVVAKAVELVLAQAEYQDGPSTQLATNVSRQTCMRSLPVTIHPNSGRGV